MGDKLHASGWLKTLLRLARVAAPKVAVVAMGIIALAHPNDVWAGIALAAGSLTPLAMILATLFGSKLRRPFHAGFAIAAGSYFLFFAMMRQSSCVADLATSRLIDLCYKQMFPNAPGGPPSDANMSHYFGGGAFDVATSDNKDATNNAGAPPPAATNRDPFDTLGPPAQPISNGNTTAAKAPSPEEYAHARNFWNIGQSLWSLLIGWIGGCFAQFLAWRQRREIENPNPQ